MSTFDEPAAWRFRLEGRVVVDWMQWFERTAVRHERRPDGSWTTTVVGWLRDEAAVRGVVTRMWDLNMHLISVGRMDGVPEGAADESH